MPPITESPTPLGQSLDYTLILFLEKKKGKCRCTLKVFYFGTLTLKLSFNNVFLLVTNRRGLPALFLSAGLIGLRNSQKTTPLATRTLSLHLFSLIKVLEGALFHVMLLGYGTRLRVFFTELRAFIRKSNRMEILWVSAVTRVPLNGCRAPRRVL